MEGNPTRFRSDCHCLGINLGVTLVESHFPFFGTQWICVSLLFFCINGLLVFT